MFPSIFGLLVYSSKDLTVCNPLFKRVKKWLAGIAKEVLVEQVLIRSTLSSISTYFMSLLQAPGEVTERLERLV